MKNFVSSLDLVPEDYIEHRPFYDRFTSLRFTTNNNRNRMAAAIAFTSGILFLLSGYKANLMVSNTIKYQQIQDSRLRESNGIIKGNNNRISAIKSTKVYLISICSSIDLMPDYTTTATILPFDTT